jgi:autotransporter strand-loop-strand O-heptosyltransferase
MPKGCVDKTGNLSFEERMSQIKGAEFFIGLSSGLSWLAWGVNVPVVLISGFTAKWNEFYTPYRVMNETVCNSCWNDVSCPFNKGDWFWCPRSKDFECSKKITSSMVIEHIKKLI